MKKVHRSLRAMITHLKCQGRITREEYDWCMSKAYGHDRELTNSVIDSCIDTVRAYYCNLIEQHPEWGLDDANIFALSPNKEICGMLRELKRL